MNPISLLQQLGLSRSIVVNEGDTSRPRELLQPFAKRIQCMLDPQGLGAGMDRGLRVQALLPCVDAQATAPSIVELLRRNVGVPDDVPTFSAMHGIDFDSAVVERALKAVPTLNAESDVIGIDIRGHDPHRQRGPFDPSQEDCRDIDHRDCLNADDVSSGWLENLMTVIRHHPRRGLMCLFRLNTLLG